MKQWEIWSKDSGNRLFCGGYDEALVWLDAHREAEGNIVLWHLMLACDGWNPCSGQELLSLLMEPERAVLGAESF